MMEERNKVKMAEEARKRDLIDAVEHKKKLNAYLDDSKEAFDEYYGMGIRPLCGDYLHDIAFQKSDKN